ncbi:hypothetical protein KL905_000549 [Ogataea polymorpha]|uniref:uncharacterized protein n=1 Tax=Ogataea polymorpha TaxID=460523 RepID=UPI0007F34914|nr:uncharacterized protein OGAPODRAFT_99974 [Ogataea polymorpha]KAG7891112.1 hypothetical protein KL936_002396 [Ogataea polymorpha]KAG7894256.1 hypothetical protein KL908_002533 [Ogataea polymorpha]KAG7923331.1 hypothetical protein KL905_000549 [Ogataea polymorpha]KAG7931758.1 hypothetical protein KL934_004170 [Ogataea polymorpha]OBA15382.1 hypothetical protein OGAPODRAFT_99974 [Ogataea polymorpha]
MESSVPIIDFSAFHEGTFEERRRVGEEVVKAMSEVGFLYIVNHGISLADQERMFEWSKAFFELSEEQKLKCEHPRDGAHHRGWSHVGREKVVQMVFDRTQIEQLRKIPDVKESFDLGNEETKELENFWPDESDIPAFKEYCLYYFKLCTVLSKKILRAIALGMGLDEEFLTSYHTRSNNQLRLLHYPPTPVEDLNSGKAERIAAHTDFGTFTMLLQDSCGGLQVESPHNKGHFLPAPYVPGSLVINTGDFLMRWSNDKLKSTLHRVTAPPLDQGTGMTRVRYSIPYFVSADRDEVVDALPGTFSEENPKKYSPITSGDYLAMRLNATYT